MHDFSHSKAVMQILITHAEAEPNLFIKGNLVYISIISIHMKKKFGYLYRKYSKPKLIPIYLPTSTVFLKI